VEHLLINPVYNALSTGDSSLAFGNDRVKYFDERVSPFVGIANDYKQGFEELFHLLPSGRKALHATAQFINEPEGWQLINEITGLQFVLDSVPNPGKSFEMPVPLKKEHIDEMVQLATLTKPGPFAERTIDFGNYYGIFRDGRLAAMAGQRLHVTPYTEVSAVCTHPDYKGRGFAAALIQHQIGLISKEGKIPYLHVREDNTRAIALYERLQFKVSRSMNFYFLKRR
jgi:ribosomal protein S18 acetylase RimI-like enzyme